MRNQNAYWTEKMAEKRQQQCWDAFCQSGSVADYLEYRSCCTGEDGNYANASDAQGSGHSGNCIS
ncbi:MAG: hypothetical protein IKQ91_08365 [Oscillospiraceae bacterium]|nr:hypothetical protein [Oscillospiraceae bacterium]